MQKKIAIVWLLTAILSIPSEGLSQSPVQWEPTLDTAQRAAGQTNRLVLIYFWAPWCTVCKHMEAEALSQPAVAAQISANYVAVKVDADNFPATARQYGVAALPTTVITTPQGQLLVSMQGRIEAAEFATRLNQIAAGAKQHGAVYAQMPTATMPAYNAATATMPAATSAAPPTSTAGATPSPMPPGGAPVTAPPSASGVNGPALTGAMPPSGASSTAAGTRSRPTDDRYADFFHGAQAAPATPIAQPPSSLAASANTQLPPPPGPAAPTANMPPPPSMPSSMPASTRGLAQGFPPSQAPTSTLPAGQAPALATAAPSYGAQPPLMPAQPANSLPPGGSPPPAVAPPLPAINPPLGLDGYCPVSLSEKQQWVPGDRRWGAIHRERTYLFAGPEEKQRFFTDPDRYAPAAAGNDVVLATEQGQAVPGMRQHGVYFGNRVYLFTSEATLDKFAKNPNVYVNQAFGSLRAGAYGGQQMR